MILVAGLVVAGLVGIAATFYFSIRSGNGGFKRNSRVRSGGSGRAGADGHPGGRRSSGTSDERPANGHRAANNSRAANPAPRAANPGSGNYRPPEQVPSLAAPVFATGNLDDTPGDASADDARPGGAGPGGAESADPAKMPRSRRRVGFRKGADIDEEMWPTESFGGVTDDQFWDDLASDKPLTTTARSAQHASGSQKRPVPPPGARVGQRPGDARDQTEARGQGDDKPGGRRARNSGGYPDAQPGAADRTAVQPVQPVQVATQPVPSLGQPASAAPARTAPFQAAPAQTGPAQAGPAQTGPAQTGPAQAGPAQAGPGQAGHLSPAGGPYQRTGPQASPPRGWRHASGPGVGADEDPLTSAAFSLRSSGPVDGNSQQVPRRSREAGWDHYDIGREHYDSGRSQETQAFGGPEPRGGGRAVPSGTVATPAYGPGPGQAYGGTAPYPYPGRPYRDPAQEASAPAATPPYGESYGYGSPAASGEDPRRPNAVRSHARHGGDVAGNRAPGPAYPPGNAHPQGGSYQGGPYDPRDDYRRLNQQAVI